MGIKLGPLSDLPDRYVHSRPRPDTDPPDLWRLMKRECAYCGLVVDRWKDKCPNCGAPRAGNDWVNDAGC